jgi:hypothetical protein
LANGDLSDLSVDFDCAFFSFKFEFVMSESPIPSSSANACENLTPRSYQLEAAAQAIAENVVVNIRTGTVLQVTNHERDCMYHRTC